jgi:hypothetical protein
MKVGRWLSILFFFLLLSGVVLQADAATITPVSGSTADNIQWGNIDLVIDGTPNYEQYLGIGYYNTGNPWGGPYTVRFDLGDTYDLTSFNLWNNGGSNDDDGEGVNDFTLNFFDAASASAGTISDNALDFLAKQTINFDTTKTGVRFVDFVINSNHSDSTREYALFYEINFEGSRSETSSPVPEPSTMLLFGVGLFGMAGIARRKK